MIKPLETSEKM